MPDKLCISILTSLLICSIAVADDWPAMRGPSYNGISTETGWFEGTAKGIKPLWKVNVGVGTSSLSVSDGRLYTMGNTNDENPESQKDVVYCLDAVTGNGLWKHSYPCANNFKSNTPKGPFATPTVDGDRVYTFSRKGDLFCLNTADGSVIWYKDVKNDLGMLMPFQGGFAGSPVIVDDKVILNAGVAGCAFDKLTGEVKWTSDPNIAAQATPVPYISTKDSSKCLAIFSGIGLVGVNADNGKQIWRYLWPTKYKTNAADPVIIGDKVFISSWYKMGCAMMDISSNKPKVLWKNDEMHNHYSSSIYYNGYIYGFNIAQLKCLDAKTGEPTWTLKGGFGRGSLIIADGKLIVLTEKGMLLIGQASPKTFKPTLTLKVINGKCYAAPVLANGIIYVKNDKGQLACVSLSDTDGK